MRLYVSLPLALVFATLHVSSAFSFNVIHRGTISAPCSRLSRRPPVVMLDPAAESRPKVPRTVHHLAQSGEGEVGKTSMLQSLYKFTRPHTIRGTILASSACVTRVMLNCIENQAYIEWKLMRTALLGLAALLCGNAYIVGINQIYDIDIDRVNKPFLPVAAGEISKPLAWSLVLGSGVLGLSLVYTFFSPLIFKLYCFGMLLGTVYTIPPFRWKNNAVLAAFAIAMVRGLLLNVGLHHAASDVLGLALSWPPQVLFIASFMTVFALVIAVAKDLPDVEGDRKYQVKTFASRLGVDKASKLVVLVLLSNYAMGIAVGFWAQSVNKLLMDPPQVAAELGLSFAVSSDDVLLSVWLRFPGHLAVTSPIVPELQVNCPLFDNKVSPILLSDTPGRAGGTVP
eukprot:753651-Hanusia_phi.AAC.1